MILRRLDKQGNEMFVKDYSKEKSLAQIILKNTIGKSNTYRVNYS